MTDENMLNFSLYKLSTGEITSTKSLLSEDEMAETLVAIGNPDRAYIVGAFTPGKQYVKNGAVFDLPPRPNSWSVWDLASEEWQDQRTIHDKVEALHQARLKTSKSRLGICLEMNRRGYLSLSDAVLASKGEWPTILQPLLDYLEAMEPAIVGELMIEWGGATMLERMDPKILMFASELNISPKEADEIFDVKVE